MPPAPVELYLYDLSQGMARRLAPRLLGVQLDGIWHTGVVVHGTEYFFGSDSNSARNAVGNPTVSGIKRCVPGTTLLGEPEDVIQLGTTEATEPILIEYLESLASSTFTADTYNLFDHNCNHFSNTLSLFLTGNSIPDRILYLPQQVLNTRVGHVIRSMFGGVNVA